MQKISIVTAVLLILPVQLFMAMPAYAGEVENPELEVSCGLDIALVFDGSDSINDTEYSQMQTAFNGFVDAFLPGTATQMAIVEFATNAVTRQVFTNDATTLHNEINGPRQTSGFTNWEQGLILAHNLFPNRDNPDLIVFASDGNPNRYGNPASSLGGTPTALNRAIIAADAAKNDGIRIETLGIGNNLKPANLIAISSADAYTESNFSELAEDMAALAEELCGGTINVLKQVDGEPTGGWEFSADVTDGSATPLSGPTAGDGYISFEIEINSNTQVSIIETIKDGYELSNASCTSNQNPIGTFDNDDSVDNIAIGADDIVSCLFENVTAPFCGDGEPNPDQGEQCDDGNNEDGDGCDSQCQLEEEETYCGDGTKQMPNEAGTGGPADDGYEDCDGIEGVGPHQECSQTCELIDLTYCGDGTKQTPNDEGTGGPANDGYEECDGTDGVGDHQECTQACELIELSHCGDGTKQTPNDEGTGGPANDGYEECDGTDGVGDHQECTLECTLNDLTYCGDGQVQEPNDDEVVEECDDGNTEDGDGCSSVCTIETGNLNICKWEDPDGQGVNSDELLYTSGWGMTFEDQGEIVFGDGITGASGCVLFEDLPTGVYGVNEENKEGWSLTEITVDGSSETGDVFFDIFVGISVDATTTVNFYNHEIEEEPEDVCPNLDGIQEEVPEGYELVEGECIEIEPEPDPEPQPTGGGGGGGAGPIGLIIHTINGALQEPTSAVITWFTNYPATTRLLYDTESHDPATETEGPPNYSYNFATAEDENKVTFHSVTLDDLIAGVLYYFRPASSASPEILGDEITLGIPVTEGETETEEEEEETTEETGEEETGTGTGETGGAGTGAGTPPPEAPPVVLGLITEEEEGEATTTEATTTDEETDELVIMPAQDVEEEEDVEEPATPFPWWLIIIILILIFLWFMFWKRKKRDEGQPTQ